MHAEDRTLGVVFETTVRLLVPLFQRPYVWKKENNWEPLWDSIKTVADRRMAGNNIRPYFLGAIVLEQLKTETGEVDARQVIDGQQRLTTLQLAIAAIRDICEAKDSENYHEAFKRLSENYVPSKKNPESIFKVWLTNVDREHFLKTFATSVKSYLAYTGKCLISFQPLHPVVLWCWGSVCKLPLWPKCARPVLSPRVKIPCFTRAGLKMRRSLTLKPYVRSGKEEE